MCTSDTAFEPFIVLMNETLNEGCSKIRVICIILLIQCVKAKAVFLMGVLIESMKSALLINVRSQNRVKKRELFRLSGDLVRHSGGGVCEAYADGLEA
ncbi:unnamed protein product [Enterobius vermicularis]|uniref:Uncharacterized protein n=1 Tax=Enterobius vermicularis TaxID=51028 RepID=A0A0N4VKA2_ENTVE|nr:unnamed protein product [Enterobius vermicularis]